MSKKLFNLSIILLLILFINKLALGDDQLWKQISINGKIHKVRLVTSSNISDISARYLLAGIDAIQSIYVLDNLDNFVDINNAKEIVILAQSGMKFAADDAYYLNNNVYIDPDFFIEENRGSYKVLGPTFTQPWWRDLYIYRGITSLTLFGLDNYNHRVQKYRQVILDAILHPKIYDKLENNPQLTETLQQIGNTIEGADWLLTILNEAGKMVVTDDLIQKLNNFGGKLHDIGQSLGKAGEVYRRWSINIDRLGIGLSAVEAGIEIYNDAAKFLLYQTLADSIAEGRLQAFEKFISDNSSNLDQAMVEGFELAEVDFQNYQTSYYNNIPNYIEAALVSLGAHFVDFVTLSAKIASHLIDVALGTAVASSICPWLLSWQLWSWLQESIEDVQRFCLAATIQDKFYSLGYFSGLGDSIGSTNPLDSELIKRSLDLFTINCYLSWYAYEKYYFMYASDIFGSTIDFFTGGQFSLIMNLVESERDSCLRAFGFTRHPNYLTWRAGNYDNKSSYVMFEEYIWLKEKLETKTLLVAVNTDKDSYSVEEDIDISVNVTSNFGEDVGGAEVSYTIKDNNNLVVRSGSCTPESNGNYGATFSARDLGELGDFTLKVIASKNGYLDGTSNDTFDVYNLALGHNLKVESLSSNMPNYERGDNAVFSSRIRNIGLYPENVNATLKVTGPNNYLYTDNKDIGNLNKNELSEQFSIIWPIPNDLPYGNYSIEMKASCPSGDEDYSDNKKYLAVGVYEDISGIAHEAYIFVNKAILWDENYQIPEWPFLGAWHESWENAPNGQAYKVEIGAYSPTNEGVLRLAMNVYKKVNNDWEVLSPGLCSWGNPQDWSRSNHSHYYDNYNLMIFKFHKFPAPSGSEGFFISMAVPVSDVNLSPAIQRIKVNQSINYQVNVLNQTYDSPEVWLCNTNEQPDLQNDEVLDFFDCPDHPNGPFNITATPTSINHGCNFAVIAEGDPNNYVIFGMLLVDHSYDARVSQITTNPPSPRSGSIVSITNTIENVGSASLTGIEVNTSITGPDGYIESFSDDTDGGNVQFDWDTLGCTPGDYTIATTIFHPSDSEDSNDSSSKTVTIGPPPYLVVMASADKDVYCLGEIINISIIVKDDSNVQIAGGLVSYSLSKDGFAILEGNAEDTGNGNYSASINAPGEPGDYEIQVQADYPRFITGQKVVNISATDCNPPSIILLSPNGIETLLSGSTFSILWNASDDINVSHIKIEYSSDGGVMYSLVVGSAPSTGSYPWIIPNTPSDGCKVRLTAYDSGGNTAFDESDDIFTILSAGQLQVGIGPQAAVDAGAQWKVTTEGNWHNSGDAVFYTPGIFTLEFKTMSGWSKPGDKQINIVANKAIFETVTYEKIDFITDLVEVEVPEGGEGEFQVRLSAMPSSDVFVTAGKVSGDEDISVKFGSELTFTPDNWNTYQTVTLEAAEDEDAADGEATIRVSNSDMQKDVTAKEQDDDKLEFETDLDMDEVTVLEGGEESFQVKLTAKPLSDVTVTVSRVSGDEDISVKTGSELIFPPDNWDTYQTIMLEAVEDDDAADGEATIRISATDFPDKDVTAKEQDDDELEFETDLDMDEVTVLEGGEESFQVRLTAKPLSDVTVTVSRVSGDEDISVKTGSELTFTPDDWDIWQTAMLEAAEDDDAADGEATIRISATDFPDKDVTAKEQDDDELEFETGLDMDEVTVLEGGEASFQIRLMAKPLSDVSVTVSKVSGDEDISVKTGSELTFTPDNWDVWQTVILEAAEDDDAADGEATIRISAADIPDKDVTAKEQDDEEFGFETDLEIDEVSVPEEGEAEFQIKLTAKPLSDVTVTVSRVSGDEDISVKTGSELTFTPDNWDVWQTILLEATEDDDAADGEAKIRISSTNFSDKEVTARENDDDELLFETDIGEVIVPEGGEESFQVRLTAKPLSDVTVSVSRVNGDEDISVKGGSALTFTPDNWNTYQMVTLEALEDDDIINGEATIRISETDGTDSEIPDKDITTREEDNDEIYFVIDEEPIEIPEGGQDEFSVKLSAQPTFDLLASINKLSGDEDITVGENTELTFTPDNWNVWQEVLLEASEDDDCLDGEAIIRISGTGEDEIESKDVIAKEEDNDFGEISLGFNPPSGAWGDHIDLFVNVSNNCQPISAFGFELVFNEDVFIYKGVDNGLLTSDWSLIEGNEISPGRIRIGGIAGGGTTINNDSDGSLVEITLQIQCLDYIEETELQVNIENYMDDIERFLPDPCTADFTFVPCPILGDVNTDGIVTPGDAQKAFEIAIGKLTPDLCQEMASNANCDEEVTFIDAQNIFDHYLGKVILPECCAEFDGSSSVMSTRNLDSIKWLQPQNPMIFPLDTIALSGEIVKVPIIITNAEGISSFSFDVNYFPDVLEFIGLEKSPLTYGFAHLRGVEEVDGLVRIEGETHTPIRDTSFGSLAIMVFRVKAGIGNELPIYIINSSEELFEVEIGEGTFIGLAHSEDETRYLNFGNAIYTPDGTLRIPVNVSSAFNLKSFGMTIKYSTEKMLFIGANRTVLTEDFMALDANELEAGIVRVGGFSMSGIQDRGPGLLVELVFFLKERGGLVEIISLEDDIHDYVIQDKTIEIK